MIQPNVWTYEDCKRFADVMMPWFQKQWNDGSKAARIPLEEVRELLKDDFPTEAKSLRKHLVEFLCEMLEEMDLMGHVWKPDGEGYVLSVAEPDEFKWKEVCLKYKNYNQ